jgi:hypothetical protein
MVRDVKSIYIFRGSHEVEKTLDIEEIGKKRRDATRLGYL